MNKNATKIKVCFIAPKAYPLFNPKVAAVFGGAEVDLYYLATELAKDDNFEVAFITADYGQEQCETIENVKIIKTADFKKNVVSGGLRVWRGLRQADAGIYMIKTISPGMFLTALFCRLKRKAFVYRTSNTNSCDGTYLRQHSLSGRLYKWALRSAARVFVQNRTDRENLETTTGVRAIAIPNGHRLAPSKQARRDTILWVGRSAQIKRPELFVDLAEKMPEEHFTMICQRATGDDNFKSLADRAAKTPNLQFVERVDFDKINACFQKAKMLVNTSEAEGFPNTFIQAAVNETPILSLNVNPDGFLDDCDCGACCNGSMNRLAETLKSLLEDNKYVNIGKNARTYAEKNHNVTTIVERYKKLFAELA
ncbi:MAG: glycosyltransferase [Sedimentisphaerales bacterium]|nr:glycosyltransferase [Sedimentisphaerales bacterium]